MSGVISRWCADRPDLLVTENAFENQLRLSQVRSLGIVGGGEHGVGDGFLLRKIRQSGDDSR